MIEKTYTNQDMNIELTSYIDNKKNIWFRGKEIYSGPSCSKLG